jgi:hypothetical protein
MCWACWNWPKPKKPPPQATKKLKPLEDGVSESDIQRVTDKIRSRIDRADAEMEMRSESLDTRMDEVLGRERLVSQLEERRRRLGLVEEAEEAEELDSLDLDI